MKFLATCWIIAVCLAGPAALHAGGCRNVGIVHHNNAVLVTNQATYVAPAVAAIQLYPVLVSLYNTQYSGGVPALSGPAYQPAAPAPRAVTPCDQTAQALKQVAAALAEIEGRLRNVEGVSGITPARKPPIRTAPGQPVQPMNPADPETRATPAADSPVAIAANRCAKCHAGDKKEGGFTLLAGNQFAEFTDKQAGEVLGRLTTRNPKKQMPPPEEPVMPAEEKLALANGIVSDGQ